MRGLGLGRAIVATALAGALLVGCGGGGDEQEPLSPSDQRVVEDAADEIDSVCPIDISDPALGVDIEASRAESAASDIGVVLEEHPDAIYQDGANEVPLVQFAVEVEDDLLGCSDIGGVVGQDLSEAINKAGRPGADDDGS